MAEALAQAAVVAKAIRVMVVDDSAVVRGLITRWLNAQPGIEVVATAANGQMALTQLARTTADVVVLDIEMPVMDGLTALPLILKAQPGLKVVMASTLTRRNAEISLKALQLGASDYIPKPEGSLVSPADFDRDLVAKIRALAGARPAGPAPQRAIAGVRRPPVNARHPVEVLAIGASTGGPPALLKVFEDLRGAVRQPIFLTQHMPASFTSLLGEQLSRVAGRECREGRDGEVVAPGRCYIAPGGWHMTVRREGLRHVIRLNQDPPENFCRPAVDPMLRSLAQTYGSGVLAVILTGMGADGARGCAALAATGGRFAVQDQATSVVWGMPGAAAETGLAERELPLADVGAWIRRNTEAAG